MDEENWLVGWREIGKYIGKSAKTAQRYGKKVGTPLLNSLVEGKVIKGLIILNQTLLQEAHYTGREWRNA
jgi:hypothetical protein